VSIHDTVLRRFVDAGFLAPDHNLRFEAAPEGLLLEGELRCMGVITITVRKLLEIQSEEPELTVQTTRYSYNVSLLGRGNIFRYDSPIPGQAGHHGSHHVHRFDPFSDGSIRKTEEVQDEDLGRLWAKLLKRPGTGTTQTSRSFRLAVWFNSVMTRAAG
jgi:hypothetical protein